MNYKAIIIAWLSIVTPIVIVCMCCMATMIILGGMGNTGDTLGEYDFKERIYSGDAKSKDKIALIKVEGVIADVDIPLQGTTANVDRITDQLDLALEDDNVKGILLWIDSPGGEVVATDNLYRKLIEVKEVKPIVVYSESIMASGGYYIAMASDYIVVHEYNISGSIGVLTEVYNFDGLFEKLGIDVKRITNTNGEYKLGEQLFDDNPNDPVDKGYIEALDTVYERFLTVILEGREINEETLRNELARGQIYASKSALENKLIDEIGTDKQAIEELKQRAGLSGEVKIVFYEEKLGFFDSLRFLKTNIGSFIGLNKRARVYYM